jgi:PAS domain S-box-containing protein
MNREAVLGKRPDTAGLPVIGKPYVIDRIREAYYGADSRTEVREVRGKNEFFFNVRITPTLFNNGTRGITVIMEDITPDKKNLASVADESRILIEGVLSCIDDAVILLDSRTGAALFANPAARELFGCPPGEPAEAPGLPGITGMLPGDSARLLDAMKTRGTCETLSRVKRHSGGDIPVSLHLRPLPAAGGEVKNIVMIIRPVPDPVPVQDNTQRHNWDSRIPSSSRTTAAGSGSYTTVF